ncbi:uncharacterized protein PITG_01143 [Phytophthora infestans T30-4]|uniref:N-acetyltransferase domain-containing protein n=1 Tax=Phytophthora infestans (strain T30-4) TaxID=403677 RepID=D0MSK5_PHYIT|nr:uncharacterized protein PITG_01143 [Phytophthora infestans T30-4]EEY58474.1 conserved hypothetical protein [Phytophthora infestans T30-4]|eukprot:XP_002909660.1 conserved hypothetical protein [Phytophthora infestans T30-4]
MELVEVTKKTQTKWLAQAVRLEKKHNTLVLAVGTQDSIVLGYILFRRNGAEGHIDRIAVTEYQRRQGVGRRLLQAAITVLQSKRLVLEADTGNLGAIALYESQGFTRTTVRADYYKPGHHALLMELKLGRYCKK